jgi:uncharacterized protein YgbK (DUF1537 family)
VTRVLILADDLTGAADCAAAFLGRARDVTVSLDGHVRGRAAVVAIDLDTRSRTEKAARAIVRRAFAGRRVRDARILFKKIDSTLRGHVAAELAAARTALGRGRQVIFAPAFPAQGRTTRSGRLYVNGVLQRGVPRLPMLDAASDADLDVIARYGLALGRSPLFVGSAGLARAIARTLPGTRRAQRREIPARPVITVVGSASPVSARQAAKLSRSGLLGNDALLVQLEWTRKPASKDKPVVRRLGLILARSAPPAHYVLTGGETARAVLGALGIGELRLLGEVEPGVPFGLARDGTLVCTKAGAFGAPDTLTRCVARLKREMERS